jgi:hypothetical protein
MQGVVESEKSANVTPLFFDSRRIDSSYIKSSNGMVLSSKLLSHNVHGTAGIDGMPKRESRRFYQHGDPGLGGLGRI